MMISHTSAGVMLAALTWAATLGAAPAQAIAPPDPGTPGTGTAIRTAESGDVYLPGSQPAAISPQAPAASGTGVLARVLTLGLGAPVTGPANSGRLSNSNGRTNSP
jgi:hypothetical protein